MKKSLGRLAVAVGASLAATSAYATPTEWYEGVTLSTAPVTTVAGVVVTALAAVWCIRKVIKLINRS